MKPGTAARAAADDPEAPPELRRFALALLADAGQATEEDQRVLRALLLADAPTKQATGAHGAALSGLPPSGPGLDAQADRERGRSAGESTSVEG